MVILVPDTTRFSIGGSFGRQKCGTELTTEMKTMVVIDRITARRHRDPAKSAPAGCGPRGGGKRRASIPI